MAKQRLKQQVKLRRKAHRLRSALSGERRGWNKRVSAMEVELRELLQAQPWLAGEEGDSAAEAAAAVAVAAAAPCESGSGEGDGAVRLVKEVCAELFRQAGDSSGGAARTASARRMLKAMAKGQQTLGMFEDDEALWGYARYKFTERGRLLVRSLRKLQAEAEAGAGEEGREHGVAAKLWAQLLGARRVCSIGCGPGCDAVGLLGLLHDSAAAAAPPPIPPPPPPAAAAAAAATARAPPTADDIVLLDWAVDAWRSVLTPLSKLLMTPGAQRGLLARQVTPAFCDVTRPLLAGTGNDTVRRCAEAGADVFLFSYVLAETHGKWHGFLLELWRAARAGALFYFAEPTAWQLHDARHLLEGASGGAEPAGDFIWLDTSFGMAPEVQALERRSGPAVMLCRKR